MDKLIDIWSKLNIEIIKRNNISKKFNALLDKYRTQTKHSGTIYSSFRNFVESKFFLFYIGKSKCELKITVVDCRTSKRIHVGPT